MANDFLSIVDKLLLPTFNDSLLFEQIDVKVGTKIVSTIVNRKEHPQYRGLRIHYNIPYRTLMVLRPTDLHETPASWLNVEVAGWCMQGRLTLDCRKKFEITVPTVSNFLGRFTGSIKIPDLAFTPIVSGHARVYPSVVLECSSERSGMFDLDSELWQEGTAGAVPVVLWVQFAELEVGNWMSVTLIICRNHIEGTIETTKFNIFPVPAETMDDPILTIDELFAGNVPVHLDPNTPLPLNLHRLRQRVERMIRAKGFIPA